MAPITIKAINQQAAAAIKRLLDEGNPQAAAINAEYSFWANAGEILERARRLKVASESRQGVGTVPGMTSFWTKAVPKPVRETLSLPAKWFDSVPWNTFSGATKASIADALGSGQTTRARLIVAANMAVQRKRELEEQESNPE